MEVDFWSPLIMSVTETYFKSCGYEKKFENMAWHNQYYFSLCLLAAWNNYL